MSNKGGDGSEATSYAYMVCTGEDLKEDWRTQALWIHVGLRRQTVKWRGKTFNYQGGWRNWLGPVPG